METYLQFSFDLARAGGFISPSTGEFVRMTATDKIVYAYLLTVLSISEEIRASQADLATYLNTSRKSVNLAMNLLASHRVLTMVKEKIRNYEQSCYSNLQPLRLWVNTNSGPKCLQTGEICERGDLSLLYVMRNRYGQLKIGVSFKPFERADNLSTQSGSRVNCLAYYRMKDKTAYQAEAILHEIFKSSREMGEWFSSDAFTLEEFESKIPCEFTKEFTAEGEQKH